ncbi:MAG TPA: hypothetical protein VGG83_10820 [Trebonia sp.]|jgi:hypothetical protein
MSVVRVYATVADYQAATGDTYTLPARVTILLRRASRCIDRGAIAATYPTDPQGYPADAALIDTFMQATCEQAMFMRDLDDDSGAKARMDVVKVGSLSFNRAKGTAGLALAPLGPGALEILQLAGVVPTAPYSGW